MAIDSLELVRHQMNRYVHDVKKEKQDSARSRVFAACRNHFEQMHCENPEDTKFKAMVSGMHTDWFYRKAIEETSPVANFPNVLQASENLIQGWENLKIGLLHFKYSDEELDQVIVDLVEKNYEMATAFIDAKKRCGEHLFPRSLALAHDVFLKEWMTDPKQAMKDLSLFEDASWSLFLRIPYQVIMHLLSSPEELKGLTGIFKPIGQEKMHDWKTRFLALSPEEQFCLTVTKRPAEEETGGPEIPLSEEGERLFKEISEEIIHLHKRGRQDAYKGEGKEKKAADAYYQFLNELFARAKQSLRLAEKWAKHGEFLKNLPENFQLEDVLHALQNMAPGSYQTMLENTEATRYLPELQIDLSLKTLQYSGSYCRSLHAVLAIAKQWQETGLHRELVSESV